MRIHNYMYDFMLYMFMCLPISALGDPAFSFEYDSNGNVIEVMGFVGLQDPYRDCEQKISNVIVDEVVYEGISRIIGGFRGRMTGHPYGTHVLFHIDDLYSKISNAEMSFIPEIIKKGAALIVIYHVCGNGGYHHVRGLFKGAALYRRSVKPLPLGDG